MRPLRRVWVWVWVVAVTAACQRTDGDVAIDEALLDPETCQSCHPTHYRQWSGSMHAYAADDPVFLAMNERGQRETDGALGDLCVQCHAPVAVALGETTDGLNLPDLDPTRRGITCYACHQIDGVGALHNNDTTLAFDGVMRGGITDPESTTAHQSEWSGFHDRDNPRSSELCGSCHDVVLDNGIHLERTYAQWEQTVFADPDSAARLSCAACHMPGSDGPAAVTGPDRRIHDHTMPGVDIALTPWPEREAHDAAVQGELDTMLLGQLCVDPLDSGGAAVLVSLDNVASGHNVPSGAAHDRRLWVELVATAGGQEVWSTGTWADADTVPHPDDASSDLWQFRDVVRDDADQPVHMFWEITQLEELTIGGPLTLDPDDPDYAAAHPSNTWLVPVDFDQLTLITKMRPVGLDVLDDLIASGDLAPAIRDAMPTFELAGASATWTPDADGTEQGSYLCVP